MARKKEQKGIVGFGEKTKLVEFLYNVFTLRVIIRKYGDLIVVVLQHFAQGLGIGDGVFERWDAGGNVAVVIKPDQQRILLPLRVGTAAHTKGRSTHQVRVS